MVRRRALGSHWGMPIRTLELGVARENPFRGLLFFSAVLWEFNLP